MFFSLRFLVAPLPTRNKQNNHQIVATLEKIFAKQNFSKALGTGFFSFD